jgi:hypothetical protein
VWHLSVFLTRLICDWWFYSLKLMLLILVMTLELLSMLTYSAIVGYQIWFHGRIQDRLKCFSLVHVMSVASP